MPDPELRLRPCALVFLPTLSCPRSMAEAGETLGFRVVNLDFDIETLIVIFRFRET